MADMVIVSFCSFFLSLILSIAVATKPSGFSIELIHRDSPKSPFHNPSEIPSQRVVNALLRSISRAHRFYPSKKTIAAPSTDIINNSGEYLMNISLGTPPVPILAIADTGSDLIWTQCKPCSQCYKQEAPLFNPKSSSTYKTVTCTSMQCQALDLTSCSGSSCIYSATYGDNSFSNGELAVDTITLGSTTGRPVALPETIFGCGHNNGGTFDEKGSGIVGLGGGNVSLVSQITSIDGKFSYCLVPLTSAAGFSSKMNFGSKGIVSGRGVVSTPLVKKTSETFYFLTLEGISVEDERINFTGSYLGTSDGNIIIDSGTTLTLLPSDFYERLEHSVSSKIDATPVESPVQGLQLCYGGNITVPKMTVHFTGADVNLDPVNTFVQVSEQITCFTFTSTENDAAIYGNLAQMNFLVGYDTQRQTVSFKPMDCTKA